MQSQSTKPSVDKIADEGMLSQLSIEEGDKVYCGHFHWRGHKAWVKVRADAMAEARKTGTLYELLKATRLGAASTIQRMIDDEHTGT